MDMYKYSNGQISLADFSQSVGMHLKADNRWVKKTQTIPWSEIEQRYAALFVNRKGNVAKPLRLALGACILQAEYGFSDEEDDDHGTGENSGAMIVDATCAPSNTRYPQDASLLNEARENSCAIWRETLPLLTKSLLWAEPFLGGETTVSRPSARSNEQQKYTYDHRCHTVPDRIVSVSQPFLRPIVRGKAEEG